jgi:hypothetical protein
MSWRAAKRGSVKPRERYKAMPSDVAFRVITRASVSSRNHSSRASTHARE